MRIKFIYKYFIKLNILWCQIFTTLGKQKIYFELGMYSFKNSKPKYGKLMLVEIRGELKIIT